MPEIVIKYKSAKTLEVLMNIAKYFDFTIKKKEIAKKSSSVKKEDELPIDFAKNPDTSALSGVWKHKDISLNELRQKAWGDRL